MKTHRPPPWLMMSIFVFAALLFRTDYAQCENISNPASAQQWLDAHNNYRAMHGVPPVAWSAAVAASAQAWANTCPTGHSSKPPRTYGENIAYATSSQNQQNVVSRWYSEVSEYDHSNPGFSAATGHFTQVVWKNTTLIGCGCKHDCSTGWRSVCVCQYEPHGNITGQFATNVLQASVVPSTPTLVAPVNEKTVSGTSLTFSWNAVSGATKYWLRVVRSSNGDVLAHKNVGNVTSYTQSGFPSNGTEYRWVVAAGNSAGWGAYSVTRTFVNGGSSIMPGKPSLSSPANGATVSGSTITFSWNKPSGNPIKYHLQLSSNHSFTSVFAENTTISGSTITGSGFPNTGAIYYWRVRAYNSVGWSPWSAPRSLINGTAPPRVTLTSPSNHASLTNSNVTLRWNAADRATIYWLGVWNNTSFSESSKVFFQSIGNVTSYTLTLPRDGRKYYWAVAGGNYAGWGHWSYYRTMTAPQPVNPGVMLLLLED